MAYNTNTKVVGGVFMTVRQLEEEREKRDFSQFACLSSESRGRKREERPCEVRTCFMRDRDKILHSKSFRRLKHKTQVFISPEGDHYRTRITHTLEVAGIARTIARALNLNESLTEAIAMGHDLGHTPFGHGGERELQALSNGEFRHNLQSVRVAEKIERAGRGLNLTYEVLDGIACHSGEKKAETLEGRIVALADRIAYINHDIDDALRSGVITIDELPKECLEVLGYSHSIRINTLVSDLIENSEGKDRIIMSEERLNSMNTLRSFMFENVYHNNKVKRDEDLAEVENIIRFLYRFYMDNPHRLPEERKEMIREYGLNEVVKDQVAGMTDRYATNIYYDLLKESR